MVPVGTKKYGTLQYQMQARARRKQDEPSGDYKSRLFEGFERAVAERGYAATTIADIVGHARVSKRTFYEYFADKDQCFLAAYEAASERALVAIAQAVDDGASWEEQIAAATRAYLAALESSAAITRTFMLEIQAAGPRALKMRREVMHRFAALVRSLVESGRKKNPRLHALTPAMSIAVVGGINELVLMAVEEGRATRLRELEATAAELVRAVLTVPRRQRE